MDKKLNHHIVFETQFGYCAVLFRENPFSLVRTLLPATSKDNLKKMVDKKVWGISGFHPQAASISKAIIDYFAGKPLDPMALSWNFLDMTHMTPLHEHVLRITSEIPYGQVRSYKNIAETLKRPKAYRYVGSCLAKNPFPIIIPCHRVVRSDLSVGKFGGGSEMKRKMIEMEARFISENMTCKQN